jgi:hypothetical protein
MDPRQDSVNDAWVSARLTRESTGSFLTITVKSPYTLTAWEMMVERGYKGWEIVCLTAPGKT